MKSKYLLWAVLTCFTAIALFLTFNKHSRAGCFNYHSEIWSDKAGYYVYLPAALKYGLNPDSFPDSIIQKTGNGFALDHKNKKVLTKYPCGVAMLQLPFYLLANTLAAPLHFEPDGFSHIYNWSVDVAAVFYLVLGLFFMGAALKSRGGGRSAFLVPLALFLGTNLYYYALDESGMSHIYSFALFCSGLFLLQHTNYLKSGSRLNILVLGVIGGLIVVVRPTNIIFLLSYFFLDCNSKTDLALRVKRLLQPAVFLPVILGFLAAITPQLLYWNYAYGSFFHYTYGNEGFNWLHPKLAETWFAPRCGLFLYTPLWLIIVAGLGWMIRQKEANGQFLAGLFLVISYVFASWYDWGFGCALGGRSYVEYLSVMSIPLASLFEKFRGGNRSIRVGFLMLMLAMVALNLKMTYSYDGCFAGLNDWDWPAYFRFIASPTK